MIFGPLRKKKKKLKQVHDLHNHNFSKGKKIGNQTPLGRNIMPVGRSNDSANGPLVYSPDERLS